LISTATYQIVILYCACKDGCETLAFIFSSKLSCVRVLIYCEVCMCRSTLRRFWAVHLKPGVARICRRMVVVRLFCYVPDGTASVQGISFCCDVVVVPCGAALRRRAFWIFPPPHLRALLLLVGHAITRRPLKRRQKQPGVGKLKAPMW
jgi:hypothetical protein